MVYLVWSPAYETGIAGIDYEHRQLVGMLNDIRDLIARGAEPSRIGDSLANFHTLASAHFALEEKIMRDENCADLADRRDIHRRLLDQVSEIMDAYESGAYRLDESLPATLREWLLEAMTIDVKLFAEVNEVGLRRWGLRRT